MNKKEVLGGVLFVLMTLGLLVPLFLVGIKQREINVLEQKIEQLQDEQTEASWEFFEEYNELAMGYAILEERLRNYNKLFEAAVAAEIAEEMEYYTEELIEVYLEMMELEYQIELLKIDYEHKLQQAYGFDREQLVDDIDDIIEVVVYFYENETGYSSLEDFILNKHPELYNRINRFMQGSN